MALNVASLLIIFMCVIIIVVGIWKIHTLPGVIAKRRNHPQAEAIEITAYLGLIAFPLWMAALIWAYLRPVLRPTDMPAAPSPAAPEEHAGPEESKRDQSAATGSTPPQSTPPAPDGN